jgi:tetratricopeptide (TPR) repeat protein
MAQQPFENFLIDLRRNIEDPIYLNNNEDVIFDWLLEEGIKPHRIPQVAEILRRIIPHYLRQPSVRSWEQLIMRYVQITIEGNVQDRLPEAHLIYSQYLLSSKEGRQAMNELAKAHKLAKNNPNQQVRIDAYVEVLKAASVFDPNKRILEPEKTYNKLKTYAEKTTNPETKAVIRYALGMYHLRRAENEQALEFATQAYELERAELHRQLQTGAESHHTRTRMIEARVAIGIIHRHRRELDTSENILADAQGLCINALHAYPGAIIDYELAWIARWRGDFGTAINYLMKAKQAFESLRHEIFVTSCDHSLGIMLIEEQNYERALKLLEGTLKVYAKIPHYANIVDVYHAIGYVYLRRAADTILTAKDLNLAENYFTRAEDIANQHLQHMPKRRDVLLKNIEEDRAELHALKSRLDSKDHPAQS